MNVELCDMTLKRITTFILYQHENYVMLKGLDWCTYMVRKIVRKEWKKQFEMSVTT